MKYTIEKNDNIAVFTLKNKNLTSEISAKFKAELLILCQPDLRALVLDLTNVEYIDSLGLGSLLLAHRQMKDYGIPVYMVGIQDMVMNMLRISRMADLFVFTNTVDEALDMIEKENEQI
jgi:anti-sigma B factor antagonist